MKIEQKEFIGDKIAFSWFNLAKEAGFKEKMILRLESIINNVLIMQKVDTEVARKLSKNMIQNWKKEIEGIPMENHIVGEVLSKHIQFLL